MTYARNMADDLIRQWRERAEQPKPGELDAWYQQEWALLSDLLRRLEVILADERVPEDAARRVMRCLLYGSPSPVAAWHRERQDREMTRLVSEGLPSVIITDEAAARLGLPLRPASPPPGAGSPSAGGTTGT